ncbi:MAG: hypothetical protein R3C18_17465 [Planctomycetaceae bacterium]
MAARKKTTKPATNVPKAQLIREWFDANPQGTAVECVKALADQGVEVVRSLPANPEQAESWQEDRRHHQAGC